MQLAGLNSYLNKPGKYLKDVNEQIACTLTCVTPLSFGLLKNQLILA